MSYSQKNKRPYLKNGSIDYQKNNGYKTALMRPFRRPLKLENRCRNIEMALYFFVKMTFLSNFL